MELSQWQQDVFDSCDDVDQIELTELLEQGYSFEEAAAELEI